MTEVLRSMKRPLGMGCVLALATLVALPVRAGERDQGEAIRKWLQSYDAALNAKDLDRLGGFYHPDVTIFEGGSTNDGWADYRDNHLGPELEEFQKLEFSHFNVKTHPLGRDGRAAYVTAEYRLKARIEDREIDAAGLETLVLARDDTGGWRIRHSHTSSRRKPTASPPPQE
jgi:ketosteroid isomerase-like protein